MNQLKLLIHLPTFSFSFDYGRKNCSHFPGYKKQLRPVKEIVIKASLQSKLVL